MWIYDLKYWFKRRKKAIFIFGIISILTFLLRFKILWALGAVLISVDNLKPAEAVFVLGGNSLDRAKAAAELYHSKLSEHFVTTGSYNNEMLKYFGIPDTEGEFSRAILEKEGVPSSKIKVIVKGMSTRDESKLLLDYALKKQFKTVIVVSDKFHTSRIRRVFVPLFKNNGIELIIHGVSHSKYNEDKYWEDEPGFLMVYNEYLKHIYYTFK